MRVGLGYEFLRFRFLGPGFSAYFRGHRRLSEAVKLIDKLQNPPTPTAPNAKPSEASYPEAAEPQIASTRRQVREPESGNRTLRTPAHQTCKALTHKNPSFATAAKTLGPAALAPLLYDSTQRPQSSSFLGLPFRILNVNPKKELLWGLRVLRLLF